MNKSLTSSPPWCGEVLDEIGPAICLLDERGRLLKANRTLLETFGAPSGSVEGSAFWAIPWPELSRQNRRMLKAAVSQAAGGKEVSQELDLGRRGHREKSLDLTLRPLSGEAGGGPRILVEGRDTTDYRQTILALHQSEARFKTIFEEADIGIVLKGVDGTIFDSNAFFQSMLGYTASELAQRNYLSVTHPLDVVVSRRLFRQLVRGERKNYTIEKRYLAKDGQTVWGRDHLLDGPWAEDERWLRHRHGRKHYRAETGRGRVGGAPASSDAGARIGGTANCPGSA